MQKWKTLFCVLCLDFVVFLRFVFIATQLMMMNWCECSPKWFNHFPYYPHAQYNLLCNAIRIEKSICNRLCICNLAKATRKRKKNLFVFKRRYIFWTTGWSFDFGTKSWWNRSERGKFYSALFSVTLSRCTDSTGNAIRVFHEQKIACTNLQIDSSLLFLLKRIA